MNDLIKPHGGTLAELMVSPERAAELQARSRDWPSWDLTPRQLCDLELLLNGGFSPLRGFWAATTTNRCASACAWRAARSGRCRSRSTFPRRWPKRLAGGAMLRAARSRGRDAGGAARRRRLAAGPIAEAQAVFGTTRPGTSRRGAPARPDASRCTWAAGSRASSSRCTTTSGTCGSPPPSSAPSSRAGLAHDRRVPDPQPDASRAPGADAAGGEGGRGEPADPSGRSA